MWIEFATIVGAIAAVTSVVLMLVQLLPSVKRSELFARSDNYFLHLVLASQSCGHIRRVVSIGGKVARASIGDHVFLSEGYLSHILPLDQNFDGGADFALDLRVGEVRPNGRVLIMVFFGSVPVPRAIRISAEEFASARAAYSESVCASDDALRGLDARKLRQSRE